MSANEVSEAPDTKPPYTVPAWRVDDVVAYLRSSPAASDAVSVHDAIRKTAEYLIGHHIDPLMGVGAELSFATYMEKKR